MLGSRFVWFCWQGIVTLHSTDNSHIFMTAKTICTSMAQVLPKLGSFVVEAGKKNSDFTANVKQEG